MTIAIATFGVSVIAISILLIRRVPDIVDLSEEDPIGDIINTAKEKIEEGVEKEIKERFECFLQVILSHLRRFFSRVEKAITRWLYILKRKKRKKDQDKTE